MKKLILTLFLLVNLSGLIKSQTTEWTVYSYGKNIHSIAHEGNFIWIGTTVGLVKLDKVTGFQTFYNKPSA